MYVYSLAKSKLIHLHNSSTYDVTMAQPPIQSEDSTAATTLAHVELGFEKLIHVSKVACR